MNYANFFLFASCFDYWIHFYLLLFLYGNVSKKKQRFSCSENFFFKGFVKIKGRALKYKSSRKNIIFPPSPKSYANLQDFLTACVLAIISMFLCFIQQNLKRKIFTVDVIQE